MIDTIKLLLTSFDSFSDIAHLSSCSKKIRSHVASILAQQKNLEEIGINYFSFIASYPQCQKKADALLSIKEEALYPDASDPKRNSRENPASIHEKSIHEALKISLLYSRIFPAFRETAQELAERLEEFHDNMWGWIFIVKELAGSNCQESVDMMMNHFRKKDLLLLKKENLIENVFSDCILQQNTDEAFRLINGNFASLISYSDKELLFHMALRLKQRDIAEKTLTFFSAETQTRLRTYMKS
jgi:hypothetical protein